MKKLEGISSFYIFLGVRVSSILILSPYSPAGSRELRKEVYG